MKILNQLRQFTPFIISILIVSDIYANEFFAQIGGDFALYDRKLRQEDKLRYDYFQGSSYQVNLGYIYKSFSLGAQYSKSSAKLDFDGIESELEEESYGISFAYHYLEHFRVGLEYNDIKFDYIGTDYEGANVGIFVQADYHFLIKNYLFIKFITMRGLDVKPVRSTLKYDYLGKSLLLGIGRKF